LTSAAGRRDIIAAKLLLILCVALAITLIQVLNLALWGGLKLFNLPNDLLAALTPGRLVAIFLLFLPVAALLSALLLYISGRSSTYREAQTWFLPLFLGAMVPPAAAFLPGIELRSAIVLVPVANISVGITELLAGRADGPMLALAWLVTAAAAVWVTRLAARTLTGERLLAAGQRDAAEALGGPALFPRRVLLWFGLFWVIQFAVALNVEWMQAIERQVLFNVVLIFGGGAFFLIRHFRLDPKEALALRAPHPAAWLAVLIGVPAGLVTGIGVFRLASLLFPMPEALLKAFSETLAPHEMPGWQMLVFLAVLPGIFEEIAFRGVLTYGLSKRLRPVALVLTVGIIFGLFHSALFRIAPTAFLGVLLTSVVLLTASIFPAMLWHGLNNALALLAGRAGADLADLPPVYYLTAAAVLALAFWILWRTRRPYPGLKS
jgi:membrane protease YdiL (CAAX protease family)